MTAETVPSPTLLLTIPEAARALAVSRSAFYNLITTGEVSVVRIGRSVRVSVGELQALIERHTDAASAPARGRPR